MTGWIRAHLSDLFYAYGYWAVFFGILLENAGVPMPGETILIVATVLATTQQYLSVPLIATVATLAAITGDNMGFAIGRFGGRPLLDRYGKTFHIKDQSIRKGEDLFASNGKTAVFVASFIAGLRVLAGPLAGVLRMRWLVFATFNALGAICWVTAIVALAYLFGPSIEGLISRASWLIVALLVFGIAYWWWRRRRSQMA
jgi:membrane-associated protein